MGCIMITKEEIQMFCEIHRILIRTEDFIYLLPHPALRNVISNYTITFPNQSMLSDKYTVIPHGSATLVFLINGRESYSSLFGPAVKPCMVGNQANRFELLLIIEFQPAGLYAFTGINQKELTDQVIPFDLINAGLNKTITEMIEFSRNMMELVNKLDQVLLTNLLMPYPHELQLATQLINDTFGNISNKELSGAVYYSERHLNRIFDQCLGMNIKSFSRLVRINKAIRLMSNPRNSITYSGEFAGFYDLPHFIHDFKSVCGLTPQEYLCSMSDFYSEIAKF